MLVGHWPLIGNTNDYSGFNNNGTPTSITYTAGKIGQAASFNGSTSSILTPLTTQNLTRMSLSFWIYNTANGAAGLIGTISGGRSLSVFRYPNRDDFHWSTVGSSGVDSDVLPFNTWTHVCLTYNGSLIKRYYNGVFFGQTSGTIAQNTAPIYIGRNDSGYSNILLNDVRIYDHALSDYEVKELAKAKFGHWKFDTNNLDSSGYGNNATNIGIISSDNKIGSSSLLVGQNTISTGITGLIYRESFSASIWFKLIGNDLTQNAGTSRSVFGNWSNYHGFMFYRNNGDSTNRYRFYLNFRTTSDTRGTISREQNLVLNTWYHVAIAGSPTGQYSFVLNGQVVQSGTLANFKSWEGEFPASQNAPFFIGRNNSYNAIEGYVDDCQLYMTYLKPEDYMSIYNKRANFDNLGNVSLSSLLEPLFAWKNFGGPLHASFGTNDSDLNLHSRTIGKTVIPYEDSGTMETVKDVELYNELINKDNITWLKYIRTYNSSGNLVYRDITATDGPYPSTCVVKLILPPNVTMANILAASTCQQLNGKVKMYIDEYYYGETDRVVSSSISIGFANPNDACSQPLNNLMEGWGARHVISYVKNSSGQDAVRCQFQCWSSQQEVTEVSWAAIPNDISISEKGIGSYREFDEVTGTQNTNAKQEITNNGTLLINGEFSEVD